MSRLCSRPACAAPAVATLTYDYSRRTVWLDALTLVRHPSEYDLCGRHADHLRVPKGWRTDDRRVGPGFADDSAPAALAG